MDYTDLLVDTDGDPAMLDETMQLLCLLRIQSSRVSLQIW
jgi:hypothetical protein